MCDALELASGPEAEVIVVGARAHSGWCGAVGGRWRRIECESHNPQGPAADQTEVKGTWSIDRLYEQIWLALLTG